MRKFLLLAVPALLVVGCGSSSKSSAPSQSSPMSGTVGGKAFNPQAAQAIKASHADCTASLGGTPVSFSADAVLIEATSAGADPAAASTLACNDLTDDAISCQYHQGAGTLAIMVANVNLADPHTVTTLAAGTYRIYPSAAGIGTPGGGAFAELLSGDPSCATSTSTATDGQVVITDVSGPITGSVSLTFPDGSITGTFSAPLCGGAAPDVCLRAGNATSTGVLCATSCVNP